MHYTHNALPPQSHAGRQGYARVTCLLLLSNNILYEKSFLSHFAADYVMDVWLKSRGPPDVWEQAAFNDLLVRREALLGVCSAMHV